MELIRTDLKPSFAATGVDQFRRIEDKFLLPIEHYNEFIQLMFSKMQDDNDLQEIKVEKNEISSLYFESDKLRLLMDHLEAKQKRFKIRIRTYLNSDSSKTSHCIEFKEKAFTVSSKKRIWIDSHNRDRLKVGLPIEFNCDLQSLNPRLSQKKLNKRIELFNSHIEEYCLRPTINIAYNRIAVEFDGVRVTADRWLKYENAKIDLHWPNVDTIMVNMRAKEILGKFNPETHCIVEVKHQNQFPQWLESFFKQTNTPQSSFSKYCWSMTSLLNGQQSAKALLSEEIGAL